MAQRNLELAKTEVESGAVNLTVAYIVVSARKNIGWCALKGAENIPRSSKSWIR